MKKTLYLFIFLHVFATEIFAQQYPVISQYMFNALVINPAYAGSKPYASTTLDVRKQWAGFEGSPTTQSATLHGLLDNKKVGLGVMITNDHVGITNQTDLFGSYAYHIGGRKGKLSFGLQAGFSYFKSNLSELKVWQNNDPVYELNTLSNVQPNFGFGMYYYAERYYAGMSVPYLFSYDPQQNLSLDLGSAHHLARHYFLSGGYVFIITNEIKIKPSFLLKYIYNAPLQADINANVLLNNLIWIGASYRTGDAVVLIGEYQLTKKLRLGYSFDLTLSELQRYSAGSHEFMIGYDFGYQLQKMRTPRYF